jgi:hypothetical protein
MHQITNKIKERKLSLNVYVEKTLKNEDTYHQNCQFVIMGFEQKYDKKIQWHCVPLIFNIWIANLEINFGT